ncbi:MAG: ATP-binding protein [Succinimonas sp.]|nr:ATP-binding protein [Succinimonas sp.]
MGIGKKITDNGLTEKAEEKSVERKDSKKEIVFIPEEPKYSLEDIIVPASVEERIRDVVEYNTIRQIVFEEWGLNKTHRYSKGMGINLYGPPGTGKTMAAHAIARSLGRKIISVNYADIESKYVGETPKNIRSAFKAAKESNSRLFCILCGGRPELHE